MKNNALFLCNIRSALNVGAIARSAAAFNVKTIFVGPETPYPTITNDARLPHIQKSTTRKIAKTALGALDHVTFVPVADIVDSLHALSDDYTVLGLEQDPRSIPLTSYRHNTSKPWLLVLGREVTGLNDQELSACQHIIEIPHSKNKESLNVSVAAGIALFNLQ
ncbi:TPA: TrmH family RNA methyltransferase [Candidatus Saccharibacteria bacterium]|nr:TrmH family RNA methyltransferase [Candidatus Saccharibacteria bacterium]HIO87439.1 TrmH family RNA methyltransferase [Candidatus Saccharibacteria bacterium]